MTKAHRRCRWILLLMMVMMMKMMVVVVMMKMKMMMTEIIYSDCTGEIIVVGVVAVAVAAVAVLLPVSAPMLVIVGVRWSFIINVIP